MRTEKEVSDEYWKTLMEIGKFNHPKLSKLRKELKEVRGVSKKEVDYMLDIILNTFRMMKNIYRVGKDETCFDRNVAKSEEYCEKIREAFAWYSKPEA